MDIGLPFEDRGNGFAYGWDKDVTDFAFNLNVIGRFGDERKDTIMAFSNVSFICPPAVWRIQLSPGVYDLCLVLCGTFSRSRNDILIEGVLYKDEDPQETSHSRDFDFFNVTVEVNDGRLSLQEGPNLSKFDCGNSARIACLEIMDAIDVEDPSVNFLFLGGPAPSSPFPDCGPSNSIFDNRFDCIIPPMSGACAPWLGRLLFHRQFALNPTPSSIVKTFPAARGPTIC